MSWLGDLLGFYDKSSTPDNEHLFGPGDQIEYIYDNTGNSQSPQHPSKDDIESPDDEIRPVRNGTLGERHEFLRNDKFGDAIRLWHKEKEDRGEYSIDPMNHDDWRNMQQRLERQIDEIVEKQSYDIFDPHRLENLRNELSHINEILGEGAETRTLNERVEDFGETNTLYGWDCDRYRQSLYNMRQYYDNQQREVEQEEPDSDSGQENNWNMEPYYNLREYQRKAEELLNSGSLGEREYKEVYAYWVKLNDYIGEDYSTSYEEDQVTQDANHILYEWHKGNEEHLQDIADRRSQQETEEERYNREYQEWMDNAYSDGDNYGEEDGEDEDYEDD